ncbi:MULTISPECIES: hypothetical protein [Streptomyces]|nr:MULTISPECIES: hypothetical protein [Streptomyces]UQS30718.1 hypothetical protein J5J01_02940 [Streptomyces fradiae]
MRRTTRWGVAAGAVLALVTAVPAWAGYKSYEGSDFSETYNSDRGLQACDMEADQNAVEGQYQRNGSDAIHHLWDKNGAGPDNCASSGSGTAHIIKHRTCEQRFAAPDVCGAWAWRP